MTLGLLHIKVVGLDQIVFTITLVVSFAEPLTILHHSWHYSFIWLPLLLYISMLVFSTSPISSFNFPIPSTSTHKLKPAKGSPNPQWTEAAKFCTALLKTHICDHSLWTSYNHSNQGICTSLEQSLLLSLEPKLLARNTKCWFGNSAWI